MAFERAPALVRGLDYYRHTAFEFVTDRLGAQGTVLGGGRYDGLMESLGGPHTPAVGWAAGIERLAMLVGERAEAVADVIVVVEHDRWNTASLGVVTQLRDANLSADLVASGSLRKRFDKAQRLRPRTILVLGDKADGTEAVLRFFEQSERAELIGEVVKGKVLPNFAALL